MERAVTAQILEQSPAALRLGHDLAPCPLVRFEQQTGAVVFGPEAHELGGRGDLGRGHLIRSVRRSSNGLSSMGSRRGSPASRRR